MTYRRPSALVERRAETDQQRAAAGRPVTVCHRCVCDIRPPDAYDPTEPAGKPVYCVLCREALGLETS